MTKPAIAELTPPAKGRDYHRDESTPGLLLQITPTGAKSWQVYRKVGGSPVRTTLGTYCETPTPLPESIKTGDQAAAWIAQQRRHLDINAARKLASLLPSAGALPQQLKQDRREKALSDPTVADLLGWYVSDYLMPRYKARGKLDDAGRCAELDKLVSPRRRITDQFGARKASTLELGDVNRWHAALNNEHSHHVANRAAELLRACYGWAITTGRYKGINPAAGFLKVKEQSREVFLNLDQVALLMQALRKQPAHWRDFFLLLLLTGQRRGAVAAMRWEHLDLDAAIWHTPAVDQKSGKPTLIVLVDQAMQILRSMSRDSSGWVFPSSSKTGHIVSPKGAWATVLADAGLSAVRVHDLRRTLGSTMANQGASLHVIGKSLGHTGTEATQVYARLQLDPVRLAQQKAADAFKVG